MIIEAVVTIRITISCRSPGIAQTIAMVANPAGLVPPVYPFFTATMT
ncbi:hypothetical protein LJR235_001876 [Pararhizobium sp. LjRoot235]